MSTKEAKYRAQAKYDRDNTKGYYFKLNKNTDKELIEFLDKEKDRQRLFKKLFKEYYNIAPN